MTATATPHGQGLAAPHAFVLTARRPAVIVAAVGTSALTRAAINGSSVTTAALAGTLFGAALLVVALVAGWRPSLPRMRGVLIGLFGGLVLIVLPRLWHPMAASLFGHAMPFVPWLLVTLLVAAAEEVVLRGVLFDASAALGPIVAIGVTSVAFALLHVPLYGWAVVPLDIGVGVWLAGLRLASGGVAAPVAAHAIADVATWWL